MDGLGEGSGSVCEEPLHWHLENLENKMNSISTHSNPESQLTVMLLLAVCELIHRKFPTSCQPTSSEAAAESDVPVSLCMCGKDIVAAHYYYSFFFEMSP